MRLPYLAGEREGISTDFMEERGIRVALKNWVVAEMGYPEVEVGSEEEMIPI